MTLIQLIEQFPDNEACREHLIKVRWPNGVQCPRCECERVSELKSRKQWTCLDCRYRFSATAGTTFHQTHIGLRKWFIAIFIILNAKKSISSLEVRRQLKISTECCWHMCHRIREAMREDHSVADLFSGIVQADEYYHGGKPRKEVKRKDRYDRTIDRRKTSDRQGRRADKTPVIGILETSTGRIRTKMLPSLKSKTFAQILGKWIDEPETHLHTDELRSYNRFGKVCASHGVVVHSREYVSADGVHTNNVESAWSLLDRAIIGSFHHISVKHLHRYLAEFDSRFNSRHESATLFFDRILHHSNGRRLPLADLTRDKIDSQSPAVRQ